MRSLKSVTVRQAKSQGGRVVGAIMADLQGKTVKQIRPFDLRQLGYVFHDTPKAVLRKEFEVRMVLDEDTKREVDFCFLLSTQHNVGLILPHSFSHYMEVNNQTLTSQNATVVNGESQTSTTNA